jgi:hypothetical protein
MTVIPTTWEEEMGRIEALGDPISANNPGMWYLPVM